MYQDPNTKEEEFPRTPREMMGYSLELLAQQFPERVVEATVSIPVYEWDSAGSEKGGVAEYIKYEKCVFLPILDEKAIALSVGHKDHRWNICNVGLVFRDQYGAEPVNREYSVLLQTKIPESLAKKFLTIYHEKIKGQEKTPFNFSYALEQVLEPRTQNYCGISLFAFDEDGCKEWPGFYTKGRSLDGKLLQRLDSLFNWDHADECGKDYRVAITQGIAEFAQGKKKDLLTDLQFLSQRKRILEIKDYEVEKSLKLLYKI